MGLLDEAIREHLDLKRRRGADPGEVERAEREALGPVRRVQAPGDAEIDEVGGQIDSAEDGAFDHEVQADESWTFEDELSEPEEGVAPVHEVQPEPGLLEDDLEPPREADGVGQETAVHRPDFLDDEELVQPVHDPRLDDPPAPHPAQEPPGLGAEPHPTEQHDGQGEELLEETPEFLQDTPDHDRLWFEQRPPKDFDFDG
jgi:hypothetical protein